MLQIYIIFLSVQYKRKEQRMAAVQKSTIKTEAYFSEDHQHRYLLRKEWDKNNKKAMVIMIQPSIADTVLLDHTTIFVMNNLQKLGFGAVEIVNLFSKIDTKVRLKEGVQKLIGEEIDVFIQKAGEKADNIIIAWGTIGQNSKKVKTRQNEVLKLLSNYQDKLQIICDPHGRKGLHPLCPSVRQSWILEPYEMENSTQGKEEEEQKTTKPRSRPRSQTPSKAQKKAPIIAPEKEEKEESKNEKKDD